MSATLYGIYVLSLCTTPGEANEIYWALSPAACRDNMLDYRISSRLTASFIQAFVVGMVNTTRSFRIRQDSIDRSTRPVQCMLVRAHWCSRSTRASSRCTERRRRRWRHSRGRCRVGCCSTGDSTRLRTSNSIKQQVVMFQYYKWHKTTVARRVTEYPNDLLQALPPCSCEDYHVRLASCKNSMALHTHEEFLRFLRNTSRIPLLLLRLYL